MTAVKVSVLGWRTNVLPFVSIAVVTVISWGGALLAPNARYWDDWVAQNDPSGLYHDIGLPWVAPLVQLLVAIGPWTFKVLGVIALVVAGCLLYLIADRGFGLSRFERWLVAVLVIVIPFNPARIGLGVLLTYTLSLTAFVLGWYLMVRDAPARPGAARYIVAAVLLFASYSTASLLPFTLIPLGHLALLISSGSEHPWKDLLSGALRRWYLFAAPVVFWLARFLFFRPTGLYSDYNTFVSFTWPLNASAKDVLIVSASALAVGVAIAVSELPGPLNRRAVRVAACLGLSVLTGALAVTIYSDGGGRYGARQVIAVLLAVSAILSIAAAARVASAADTSATRAPVRFLEAGLLIFFLGALPYLLVGKPPTFSSWDTRNQLLLPFGTAVIVLAGIRSISQFRAVARIIGIGALAACMLVAMVESLALVADWNKQAQITAAMADSEELRQSRTIVIDDAASALNFDGRSYSSYEALGWLRTAFHDQSRFVLDRTEIAAFLTSGPVEGYEYGRRYGYASYTFTAQGALLEIRNKPGASWWGLVLDRPSIDITVTKYSDISVLQPTP